MLSKINYEEIKKYKRYYTTDLNMGSKLYYDKELIHKLFYVKPKNFESILLVLDELNLNELVEIKNLIYKDNMLVGYSIINYKEYKSLKKFKNRSFKLKIEDSLLMAKSFNKLLNNNLGYTDFHFGNVLLNPYTNDIKICDLDSLLLINNKADLNKYLRKAYIFILSYLYQLNYNHIRNVINSEDDSTYLQTINIKEKDINIDNICSVIENLNYKDIKKDKKLIISKSKKLIDSGYPKYL